METLRGRVDDSSGNLYRDLRADLSTHTLITIDDQHHEIHEGNHYTFVHGCADIGALTTPSDTLTITFSTPNTTKWANMEIIFNGVGGAIGRIREGGSGGVDPTNSKACINNNRNTSNTSGLLDMNGVAGQLSMDAGNDSGGTLLFEEYLAGASTNFNRGGEEGAGRVEWLLKQNTRYQISLYSVANVAASIVLHWHEHTDRT